MYNAVYDVYVCLRPYNDAGRTVTLKLNRVDGDIDNSSVVPYCSLLCKIFISHINFEVCKSVKAIEYILKYINKHSDKAIFNLQRNENNELMNEVDYKLIKQVDMCVVMKLLGKFSVFLCMKGIHR